MSMDTNHGNDFNKNTTDRNMNDKSVTAFLLSPRYRIIQAFAAAIGCCFDNNQRPLV